MSDPPAHLSKSRRKALQLLLSLGVVAVVFFFALPRFADFSKVWAEVRAMTWIEVLTLVVAALWNFATYWFVMVASLPGSNLWQAMKVNLTSTAVSNTLPGGSALGIGVTYGMYSAYGFSHSELGLSAVVSGLWNNFVKLGMPILALSLLALQGEATAGRVAAALIGVGALAAAILLFALSLHSDRFARRLGQRVGSVVSFARRVLHKPPTTPLAERFSRFRREAIALLRGRWLSLTLATLVSHLSLFVVLLLSLRHIGVSDAEVGWAEALAAFSFVRLVTALPITPGGLGVVELGLVAALVAAGGARAQVVAAVLVYRVLTYVLPIPFGLAAYLQWRRGSEDRKVRAEQRRAGRGVAEESAP